MSDAAPALRKISMPTGRFVLMIWASALAAGAIFAGAAIVLGFGAGAARNGPAAAGVVGVAASLVLLAIRPWRPKTLLQWPVVWTAASFVRMVATLAGAYLLYSATQLGGKSLWMAVAFAYLAVMIGETRVYAMSMKRFAPGGAEASTPE